MAVFAIVVVLAAAAMTIDVGHAFVAQARLQNASDSAALAAALELMSQFRGGESYSSAKAAATYEATALKDLNYPEAGILVYFGTWGADGEFLVYDGDDWPQSGTMAVRATTFRDTTAPGGRLELLFAPVVGLADVELRRSAVAGIGTNIRTVYEGLSPFAIYEDDVPALGEPMTIYPISEPVPGCFGLLNLDGGSLGTPEIIDWILNGYDGGFTIDPVDGYTFFEGSPGFRAAIEGAVQQRIGEVLTVCVYDEVTGQGANAHFRLVRFLALTIMECDLTGGDQHIDTRIEYLTPIHDAAVGGSTTSPNLYRVQLVQ